MADTKIKVNDHGPLYVEGDVKVLDGQGQEMSVKGPVYLCRCGLSKNKPFCDGSHKGKFNSEVRSK